MTGSLIASGSNDKTVRVIVNDPAAGRSSDNAVRLHVVPLSDLHEVPLKRVLCAQTVVCTGHDGTVRAVEFFAPSGTERFDSWSMNLQSQHTRM